MIVPIYLEFRWIYILYNFYYVSNQGKIVHVCWIPRHIGIKGNNEADKAANSVLEFEIVKFQIPSSDLKHFIKLYILSLADILGLVIQVNYILIQNKVNKPYYFNLKRSDQVVILIIRIGRSKLTHTYL